MRIFILSCTILVVCAGVVFAQDFQPAGAAWITKWWALDGLIINTGGFEASAAHDWLSEGTGGRLTQRNVSTMDGLTLTEDIIVSLPNNGGDLGWEVITISPIDGNNMSTAYGKADESNIETYAIIVIDSPDARTTTIHPAHDDYAHIWLNGEKVYDNPLWTTGATLVTTPIDVSLGKGQNVLLFRCGESGGSDYFNLHFEPTDADLEIIPTMDHEFLEHLRPGAAVMPDVPVVPDVPDVSGKGFQPAGAAWITKWWALDGLITNTGGFDASAAHDWLNEGTDGELTQEEVSTMDGLKLTEDTIVSLPNNGGDLGWKVVTIDPDSGNNMSVAYGKSDETDIETYAIIMIDSPDARTTTMHPAHDDYAHIWLNGEKVYDNPLWTTGATLVTMPTEVTLNKGTNVLLYRCGEGGGSDYFNLHFEASDDDLKIMPTMDNKFLRYIRSGIAVDPFGKRIGTWGDVKQR
jgi:hypothetical protein